MLKILTGEGFVKRVIGVRENMIAITLGCFCIIKRLAGKRKKEFYTIAIDHLSLET
jgi:hypothetical protein